MAKVTEFCLDDNKESFQIQQPFEINPEQIPVMPKITASVLAPMKVELERRIRFYAQQDINQLLVDLAVNLLDLLPDVCKCNGEGDDETLSLHFFDDNDVEQRSWHLRFTWIRAHRPSIKGSKLLFPVIKAIKIK